MVDQTYRADQTRRKAAGNPPISRHPLFPAIVALWFGALFGLASIAIKPAFIEGIVVTAGLDTIVPMAAPPLGTTARILISLGMIGLGGVVGMLIARRIAGTEPQAATEPKAAERQRGIGPVREKDAPVLPVANEVLEEANAVEAEPFSLEGHEEAAEEVEAPESPSPISNYLFDSYSRDISPLATTAGEIEDQPADPEPAAIFTLPPETERHLPSAFDEELMPEIEEMFVDEIDTAPAPEPEPEPEPEQAIVEDAFDHAPAEAQTFSATEIQRDEMDHAAAKRIASAELDELSSVELLERLALAIARRRSEVAQARDEGVPFIAPVSLAEVAPSEQAFDEPSADEAPPVPQVPRFASVSAEAPEATATEAEWQMPPSDEAGYWPAEDEGDVEQDAFSSLPAALRPVGYDSANEEDALPGYVPPRRIGLASVEDAHASGAEPFSFDNEDVEDEEEEGEVLDEGYSSLLNLSRPSMTRQPFDAFDHPETDDAHQPVAIVPDDTCYPTEFQSPAFPDKPAPTDNEGKRPFDAPGGRAPEDTEKALRAALAALQRMSGAA